MLEELKEIEPLLNPENILIDFEMSSMAACRHCFPEIQLDGCLFHFSQFIWKRLQKAKLHGRYGEDEDFALRIKMLIALAFVPVNGVIEAYKKMIKTKFFSDDRDIDKILDYFEPTWLGKADRRGQCTAPLFPIHMWNCHEVVLNEHSRTNNFSEAWNRGFSSRIRICHASVGKFINALKTEQGTTDVLLDPLTTGRGVVSGSFYF